MCSGPQSNTNAYWTFGHQHSFKLNWGPIREKGALGWTGSIRGSAATAWTRGGCTSIKIHPPGWSLFIPLRSVNRHGTIRTIRTHPKELRNRFLLRPSASSPLSTVPSDKWSLCCIYGPTLTHNHTTVQSPHSSVQFKLFSNLSHPWLSSCLLWPKSFMDDLWADLITKQHISFCGGALGSPHTHVYWITTVEIQLEGHQEEAASAFTTGIHFYLGGTRIQMDLRQTEMTDWLCLWRVFINHFSKYREMFIII